MATFSQTLKGDINLVGAVGGNTYNLELPIQTSTALPNALDNSVLEEVYIKVDITAGPVEINLPAISLFNYAWNTKIYISLVRGTPGEVNSLTVYPYFSETSVDSINGANNLTFIATYETNYLHIVDNNLWMCLNAPGVVIP